MSEPNINLSDNLLQLINRLIVEKHYDGIPILLQDKRKCNLLKDICSDLINICIKYLNDDYYINDITLYSCCEYILKTLAQYACQDEILFELLEIAETTKSDNTFTSVLKALQICLLRQQQQNRTRALEWSLNSIQYYLSDLPIPDILQKGYDEKQEKLLEEDEKIRRILTNYITVTLFYEPILKDVAEKKHIKTFVYTGITRENILACFLLQMLNKPLALLNLSLLNLSDTTKYSYAFQCCKQIVKDLCVLFPNPLYFLSYVEKRIRWKPKLLNNNNDNNDVYELASKDIFLIDEKIPIISLGILYYLLYCENLLPINAPKIYNPLYIFETNLYLCVELLNCNERSLNYKGILLCINLLQKLRKTLIVSDSLELKVHSEFCNSLIKIILYSDNERNRKLSVKLLKSYILQFDNNGRYFLLKNLMKITKHSNLLGYIYGIYKDVIANYLESNIDLIDYYKDNEFKNIILNFICKLNDDVETDLIQYSDQIMASLNVIRYFLIADKLNKTGIWNIINDIKYQFLIPLRKAILLSRAHYKAEEYRLRNNENIKTSDDIHELNGIFKALSKQLPELTRERKLDMLASAIITFDLIESLLVRVNECIDIK